MNKVETKAWDAQVNPWIAALVIVSSITIFAVKFWADGERARVPSPSFVRAAPDGGFWLAMDRELLKFDDKGQQVGRLALSDVHVTELIGDIGVFSNGDLLLRAEPPAGDGRFPAGSLLRCNPLTHACQRFGDLAFNKVFRIHIDEQDSVFIADTTRHRVLRRDASGKEQGTIHEGLRYPNQLWRHGDRLYVTVSNAGSDAVQWFAVGGKTLGDKLGSADVGHLPGVAPGHVMGSDIVRVGDQWWVNLMRQGQKDGGIYRFDAQWRLLGRLPLPGGADPLVMAPYQGGVLLTDFKLQRILRFAADGTAKPDVTSPDVAVRLAQWGADYRYYSRIGQLALLAFAVLLVTGFVAGIRQLKTAGLTQPAPTLAEQSLSVDDPAITWLDVDPQLKRQQQWAIALVSIGFAAVLWVMKPASLQALGVPLVGIVVLLIPVFWLQQRQIGQRIGVRGDLLVLKNGAGRTAVGSGSRIVYSDNHVLVDDVSVTLGNGIKSLFPKDRLVQEVYPLLKQGRYLKPSQMQSLLIKRMDPVVVLPLVLVILVLLVFLADAQGWWAIGLS